VSAVICFCRNKCRDKYTVHSPQISKQGQEKCAAQPRSAQRARWFRCYPCHSYRTGRADWHRRERTLRPPGQVRAHKSNKGNRAVSHRTQTPAHHSHHGASNSPSSAEAAQVLRSQVSFPVAYRPHARRACRHRPVCCRCGLRSSAQPGTELQLLRLHPQRPIAPPAGQMRACCHQLKCAAIF
jgi:hypothetical protein